MAIAKFALVCYQFLQLINYRDIDNKNLFTGFTLRLSPHSDAVFYLRYHRYAGMNPLRYFDFSESSSGIHPLNAFLGNDV